MPTLPPLNALRAFEAAARHRSFARAAKELHVTAGAVSQQVKQLEEWLEIALFEREPRGLRLSAVGKQYLARVGPAFVEMAKATQSALSSRSERTLTVAVMASFASLWLVPRLPDFMAAHPDIDIRIACASGMVDSDIEDAGDRLRDFARQPADLSIRYGRGVWAGVDAEQIAADNVFPVCAPSLLGGKASALAPDDLKRFPLLHDLMPEHWGDWLAAVGVRDCDATRGPTFSHTHDMLNAAALGHGIALGRDTLVADAIAAGRLVRPFSSSIPAAFSYYLVWTPEVSEHPHVIAFRDWLHRAMTAAQIVGT